MGLIAWRRNISRSSTKVSTASISPSTRSLSASPFLAMQGPTKAIFRSGPNSRRSARAVASIGETIGASAGTSSGW